MGELAMNSAIRDQSHQVQRFLFLILPFSWYWTKTSFWKKTAILYGIVDSEQVLEDNTSGSDI